MNSSGTRLAALTKELAVEWEHTRETWRDAKGDEFDRKYMQELLSSVDKTLGVIEQVDKLLTRIRKDCE